MTIRMGRELYLQHQTIVAWIDDPDVSPHA